MWLPPSGVRPPAPDLRVRILLVLAGAEPLLVLSPTSQQGRMELAGGRTPPAGESLAGAVYASGKRGLAHTNRVRD
jgi:hypothetical protein